MSVILQSDQESLEFRKIALIFAMETICRAGRDTDAENGLVNPVWEGESGMNGESNINIYTLSSIRWLAYEKLLWRTGSPV